MAFYNASTSTCLRQEHSVNDTDRSAAYASTHEQPLVPASVGTHERKSRSGLQGYAIENLRGRGPLARAALIQNAVQQHGKYRRVITAPLKYLLVFCAKLATQL